MDRLHAVCVIFSELVRKKEIKCNNNQLPEVPMAPGIKTKLSKTEKLILVDVLRQINVIKDTIKGKLKFIIGKFIGRYTYLRGIEISVSRQGMSARCGDCFFVF